jgi:diguanylate cyclase (GGDEF)-like protein
MMKLGLTARLSILLVCIGVAASGATGYYAYRANRAMMMQEAERSLLPATQLLSQRFTAALGDVADDVLVLATMPSAVAVARGDDASDAGRARLSQVFLRFMMHHPEYLTIRLVTRASYGLERIRVERGPHGIVVAPDSRLQEKGHFAYVFDTLATVQGHAYLSPIGLTRESAANAGADAGRPGMYIGAPIVDSRGNEVGVLVVETDLTQVFQKLERDLPAGYLVYLANQWGDFLIHPDPGQTFGFERGRRVLMQKSFHATAALFDGGPSSVTFNGAAGAGRAPVQAFAFVRSPFGSVEGNRFIIVGLGRSLTSVMASANTLGGEIVRMVLVSSAIAIVLAALFARALARPLRVLADAATQLFDGDSTQRLPINRSDEIGVLARCFDRMRLEIRAQMSTLHARQQELSHLAGHDTLTGLPNRMRFMERFEASVQRAVSNGERLAIMFVDLDGFKQINDRFGHSAGDETLVAIAQRLREALPEADLVARLGGDEFVILFSSEPSIEAIDATAQRIQAAMDEPVIVGTHRMRVGASMGISEFPADGQRAEELLAKADAAMYVAKTSIHRRYVRFQALGANEAQAHCGSAGRLA